MFTLMVDNYVINYTDKYNYLQNNHVNKYHSVNTKNQQKKRKMKVSTCILFLVLMAQSSQKP